MLPVHNSTTVQEGVMTTATISPTASLAHPSSLEKLAAECEELAHTDSDDTHAIASLLQRMMLEYYADVRKQARHSFHSALGAAVIGTGFFIYAVWVAMKAGQNSEALIGVIAGALVQVISAINFILYARAARQFAAFHICLERTNRFILANSLCEKLQSPHREEMRKELIQVVAHAPMLTMDVVTGERSSEAA
jgi:hypothetical protein